MTTARRLVILVSTLLVACALSHAQKTKQDPLDLVMTELQAGRMEKALAALDELIKQYPDNPDAYLLRGSLKMQIDPTQALSDFNKVIQLNPESGIAYNQRAIIRLVTNDTAGAIKDLDAAIARNVKDDAIYYLRGQLRWQVGELKPALSDLDETIRLNPNNPRAYSTRAELLLALKEVDRAFADLNYLISWYETEPSARSIPKRLDQDGANSQSDRPSENDPKGLKVQIDQQTTNEAPGAKEMAPTIAGAYINRGVILNSRNNHDAALSDFDKAIRIDPANVRALYLRANEYEHKNDFQAALADITKAIQLEPKNGNLMVEHGVILSLMGRDKEAQAVFDVLLQSDRALWQKRIDERIAAVRKRNSPK